MPKSCTSICQSTAPPPAPWRAGSAGAWPAAAVASVVVAGGWMLASSPPPAAPAGGTASAVAGPGRDLPAARPVAAAAVGAAAAPSDLRLLGVVLPTDGRSPALALIEQRGRPELVSEGARLRSGARLVRVEADRAIVDDPSYGTAALPLEASGDRHRPGDAAPAAPAEAPARVVSAARKAAGPPAVDVDGLAPEPAADAN